MEDHEYPPLRQQMVQTIAAYADPRYLLSTRRISSPCSARDVDGNKKKAARPHTMLPKKKGRRQLPPAMEV